MAQSVPAIVKPALLIWGRERAGLTLAHAALKADVSHDLLAAWELGDERPSIAQLRKLAAAYKRPLAVFFLPEPPIDFDAQREFRRLPGLTPQNETPELRQALRLALYRREAAKSIYERMGESFPELIGGVHPEEDEQLVSERVRAMLGISWHNQLSWRGPYAALDAWRSAIEKQGVMVFQTGGVALNEIRGISIPEGPLPVILLNNKDAAHARIFTLVHEFIHLLLTNSGHRTSKLEGQKMPEDQLLERVSNRFAAAVLMPKREFLNEAASHPAAMMAEMEGLNRLATKIKVSPEAILRRLVSLHRISAGTYRQKRKAWQSQPFPPSQSSGAPPIEVKTISSTGKTFAALVIQGYQRNAVSSSDVADYLNIPLKYLQKISDQLLLKPGMEAPN